MDGLSEIVARLDDFVVRKLELDSIPGLAIAVTDRLADVHRKSHGVSDIASGVGLTEDMLFQIGSISKSFTSIALLQLQERGKVDVHRPLEDYLPWFRVKSRYPPITLHHLMTHTAGIPLGSESAIAGEAEVWWLRNHEVSAPPGEFFHYSNTGYKALGLVLEEVTGMPCGEVVSREILGPLGMDSTVPTITNSIRARTTVGHTWFEDDRPHLRKGRLSHAAWTESDTGDGSISSTPEDMAKYVRMLLSKGEGPHGRVLSERSFELLTSPYIICGEEGRKEYYGYGICVEEVEGRQILSHTGGMVGYTSSMLLDMDFGAGIIVLTNSEDEPEQVSRYFLSLLNATKKGEPLPEARPPAQRCVPKNPSEYAGDYHGVAGSLKVREKEGLLHVLIGDAEAPMECVKDDHFLVDHPDFRLFLVGFTRAEGKVVGATYGGGMYSRDPEEVDGAAARLPGGSHEVYVGHYRSRNPWSPGFRVVDREGTLLLVEHSGTEQVLVPRGEGVFRVGQDPRSPEEISFDMIVKGRAMRADLSGGLHHRVSTP